VSNQKQRKQPSLTVDAIVIHDDKILLIKRKNPPFRDHYALPGGFVEYGETTENACLRELMEETGVKGEIISLVGVYSDPNRDPRGHVISIAYLCKPLSTNVKAGSDAKQAQWLPLSELDNIKLAFDHKKIVRDALNKYRDFEREI